MLKDMHREELKELKAHLEKFKLAGISEKEILGCVKDVYGGNEG